MVGNYVVFRHAPETVYVLPHKLAAGDVAELWEFSLGFDLSPAKSSPTFRDLICPQPNQVQHLGDLICPPPNQVQYFGI